jgi:hypothetical protein
MSEQGDLFGGGTLTEALAAADRDTEPLPEAVRDFKEEIPGPSHERLVRVLRQLGRLHHGKPFSFTGRQCCEILGLGSKSDHELHAEYVLKVLMQRGVLRKVDCRGKNGARRWLFVENATPLPPPPRVLPGVAAADPGPSWWGVPKDPLMDWWEELQLLAEDLDEPGCVSPAVQRLIEDRLSPGLERLAEAGLSDGVLLLGKVCLLLAGSGANRTFGIFTLGASRAAEAIGSGYWENGAAALAELERGGLIRCVERGRPGKGCSRWVWVSAPPVVAQPALRPWEDRAALASAAWN